MRADASGLLGHRIAPPEDRRDVVWRDSVPPLAPETRALRGAVKRRLPPGVTVTGSWVAGTGLASVVDHASLNISGEAPDRAGGPR